VKLLEQVENQVWLELLDSIANGKKFVLYAECACLMAKSPKTLHDVEFGFERERLLRREPLQRIRWHVVGVHEHQNAQLFHRGNQSRRPSV